VYTRPDSPFYWIWLEGPKRREKTAIRILPKGTAAQRKTARQAAEARYAARMIEIGNGVEPMSPRLLTVPQAAAYLGISAETMNKYAARGVVPVVMLPPPRAGLGGPFIDRWDLDALIERSKERHETPPLRIFPVARGAPDR
jgi:hypothetical protein